MHISFTKRDGTPHMTSRSLTYDVQSYSKSIFGGPEKARIVVHGDNRENLYQLFAYLLYGVEIYNDQSELVWWGYVDSVYVSWNGIQVGYSVREMANKIRVGYDSLNQRFNTDWVEDAESIQEFGTKELLFLASRITSSEAEAIRDRLLDERKWPIPEVTLSQTGENIGILNCLSYAETLKWRYYENALGYEGYEAQSGRVREIGEDDRPKCAQRFVNTSGSAWTAQAIYVKIQTYPYQPTDALRVSLYTEVSNKPGTELAYASLPGTSISADRLEWYRFSLNTGVSITPGIGYWIVLQRTGSVDPDTYYVWETNSNGGYLNGYIRIWNGSEWNTEPQNYPGDMLFRVVNEVDTTEVLKNIINDVGEHFTGIDVHDLSGIMTTTFRSGDLDAHTEIMRILDTGTSLGYRLLFDITPKRRMRVYVEAAKPNPRETSIASLRFDGVLLDKYGKVMNISGCPVGFWCKIEDMTPIGINLPGSIDNLMFFVETAEYNVINRSYRITRTRSVRDYLDFGITVDY